MKDADYMAQAIAKAREGIERGQTPFGACIVQNGEIVALEHNAVWAELDITAHAEIQAIRRACRKLGTIDLSGTVIYSTCEPCPMCFSAIHWAKIDRIVFGARIADAKALGFSELEVSNETLKRLGPSPVEIQGDYRREECLELFRLWSRLPHRLTY
jgi:tRNA(Arg) A34 adenosine deaminase TadA